MHSIPTATIYWLVVIAVFTSTVAFYAGLTFAARAIDSDGSSGGGAWFAASSLAIGLGVWSTHYLAALSLHPSIDEFFQVPTALLSLVPAVVGAAIALWLVDSRVLGRVSRQRAKPRPVWGGLVLGVAVGMTHTIGMMAMRSSASRHYGIPLNVASVLLAIVVSATGLALAFVLWPTLKSQEQREWLRMRGALVLGLGISGADCLAHAGVTFWATGDGYSTSDSIRVASLGLVAIAITIFSTLVGALVLAIFDRRNYSRLQAANRHLREARLKLRKSEQELRAANARLVELSMRDGLTGIYNRRHFEDALAAEWRRAIRSRQKLAVLLIDIDHFKALNDTHGHNVGDECLRAVAKCLKQALRRPGDMIARFGGEEFAAILPNSDAGGAMLVAETLRIAVENLSIKLTGSTVAPRVTVSVGGCSKEPTMGDSQDMLIAVADQALYRAKKAGRNCIRVG